LTLTISVILPVYNGASFISRAIDSALNQTHSDVEIIVVDDGSTDATSEKLHHYSERITAIHIEHSGRSVARNRGIDAATGDYIAFLDADDTFTPEHLHRLALCAMQNNAEIVYDDALHPFLSKAQQTSLSTRRAHASATAHFFRNEVTLPACMIKRDWLNNHAIRFDPEREIAEDTLLIWECIAHKATIVHAPGPGLNIGVHERNSTRDDVITYRSLLAAYEAFKQRLAKTQIDLDKDAKRKLLQGEAHARVLEALAAMRGDVPGRWRRSLLSMGTTTATMRPLDRLRCGLGLLWPYFPGSQSRIVMRCLFGYSALRNDPRATTASEGRERRVGLYCVDQDARTTSTLGVFNFTQRLITQLANAPAPENMRLTVWVSDSNAEAFTPEPCPEWIDMVHIQGTFSTGLKRLFADNMLSVWLARSVDLVHFPKGWLPLIPLRRTRTVCHVHDCIPRFYVNHYPRWNMLKMRYFAWNAGRTLRKADRIITISHYSVRQIRSSYDTQRPIGVIPAGAISDITRPRTRHPDASPILVMGSTLPHKRTAQTLDLLNLYAQTKGIRLPVTVTGIATVPAPEQQWSQLDLNVTGRLSTAQLDSHLRNARALVYLSEIEGFGLPPLEAYERGIPVCYRAGTAVDEILNHAPGAWDPTSDEAFIGAMDEALSLTPDQIEAIQDQLSASYNWPRIAKELVREWREQLC
jgi:succinoglycan biosynthesis protein ExoO